MAQAPHKHTTCKIRCGQCEHEYLLAFSCRARWFCPACHEKKSVMFAEFMMGNVLNPVPHRQYVFSIPKMLRVYFRYNRKLLTMLSRLAYESMQEYIMAVLNKPKGELGVVLVIQTFGEYLNYHPHLHVVAADGVFMPSGVFYVMPGKGIKPIEELFRNKVIKLLINEGVLGEELGKKMLKWRHSGFGVYKSKSIRSTDKVGLERICQYVARNTFSTEKMMYNQETGKVIYRSKENVRTKRNFEIFEGAEFIAELTQHIPEKSFQLVRYYGWYSNKKRGMRKKLGLPHSGIAVLKENQDKVRVIDVSEYQPKGIASKKWRELIKKIWEKDPLICPKCGSEMKIIALIDEKEVIEKILRHLNLWEEEPARAPPEAINTEVTYEPIYDDYQPGLSETEGFCPEEYPMHNQ
ncbi:MAG: transposase [bacterium]